MDKILLGVCGSIAAYKAAPLIRLLRQHFAVQVMMTPTAQQFIGVATLQALSGETVAIDEWQSPISKDGMDHIALPRAAKGLLIAPASANFLAKAAAGIADNLLLSSFLAAPGPRWVAPAMNVGMWQSSITQHNISRLVADGVHILPPISGEQACGDYGYGKMMEPEAISQHLYQYFTSSLRGRKIVVSTGATVEKIDDMRVISNLSSGQMGFCVAESAQQMGAEVTVIAGQTTATPPCLPIQKALSHDDMHKAVIDACKNADIFIAAAAVSDFIPEQSVAGKINRNAGKINLKLIPSNDILADIAARYPSLLCVGFAAQSGHAAARVNSGKQKMLRKKIAMIAVNSLQDAGKDNCQLTLLTANRKSELPRQSKKAAAAALMNEIATALVSRETSQEVK